MRIQEGKYYRTRDGRKVGPAWLGKRGVTTPEEIDGLLGVWHKDGTAAMFGWDDNQHPHLDLVAEWKDTEVNTEGTPKLWKDMTDEEKGALLLAHHEGKIIEYYSAPNWLYDPEFDPNSHPYIKYRVKPAQKEPKRETVTLYGSVKGSWGKCESYRKVDTHKITFDLIDGVPDCDSINMEEL